jgi:hypothetical protein
MVDLGGDVLSELRLDILETEEVRRFNPINWLKEKIEEVKRAFREEYELSNIDIQVSAGIPSGISASLKLTLKPKQ